MEHIHNIPITIAQMIADFTSDPEVVMFSMAYHLVPSFTTKQLSNELELIAKSTSDVRLRGIAHGYKTGRVQDVIDPSLFATSTPLPSLNASEDESKKEKQEFPRVYQWLPVEIKFSDTGAVDILSQINLFKRDDYSQFYGVVGDIIKMFRPLFEDVIGYSLLNKECQVIIKSIQYIMNPSEYYSTVWHKEGNVENIIAAGIYYYEAPPEISGDLEFRIGGDYMSLHPEEGSCVVFSNKHQLHRAGRLHYSDAGSLRLQLLLDDINKNSSQNETVEKRRKLFAIFLVDPENKIQNASERDLKSWKGAKMMRNNVLISKSSTRENTSSSSHDLFSRMSEKFGGVQIEMRMDEDFTRENYCYDCGVVGHSGAEMYGFEGNPTELKVKDFLQKTFNRYYTVPKTAMQ